jgi:hypothetical protein
LLGVGVECDVTWVFSICTTQEHKEKERERKKHIGDVIHTGADVCRRLSCPTKIVIWEKPCGMSDGISWGYWTFAGAESRKRVEGGY